MDPSWSPAGPSSPSAARASGWPWPGRGRDARPRRPRHEPSTRRAVSPDPGRVLPVVRRPALGPARRGRRIPGRAQRRPDLRLLGRDRPFPGRIAGPGVSVSGVRLGAAPALRDRPGRSGRDVGLAGGLLSGASPGANCRAIPRAGASAPQCRGALRMALSTPPGSAGRRGPAPAPRPPRIAQRRELDPADGPQPPDARRDGLCGATPGQPGSARRLDERQAPGAVRRGNPALAPVRPGPRRGRRRDLLPPPAGRRGRLAGGPRAEAAARGHGPARRAAGGGARACRPAASRSPDCRPTATGT